MEEKKKYLVNNHSWCSARVQTLNFLIIKFKNMCYFISFIHLEFVMYLILADEKGTGTGTGWCVCVCVLKVLEIMLLVCYYKNNTMCH